jgi:hypothetical protein
MDIKRRKLNFLEHMIRVDQVRETKTIFESKPEGKKIGKAQPEIAETCNE